VAVNPSIRGRVPRENADGTRARPSLPLDLYYLVSAWAADPAMQHSLLGWGLRALADMPTLPRGVLNATDLPAAVFGLGEAVELVCDPLPADQLWYQLADLLKPSWPPTVMFIARPVVLDSSRLLTDPGPAVQTRALGFAPDLSGVDA
jgi:hypothetical protein